MVALQMETMEKKQQVSLNIAALGETAEEPDQDKVKVLLEAADGASGSGKQRPVRLTLDVEQHSLAPLSHRVGLFTESCNQL